ncbi:hypothetical protein SCOCK_160086 [Actinacidiphila cocklensis]|uniref:Uncharacterized protein n=1 Tax=Actinacidiphila cocklensis TaxID=887465 RepID=A0A9W4DLD3_9ACTN|nr:hypothetical protein SCOCK_160086 [Actinacidiphila cocklensis]
MPDDPSKGSSFFGAASVVQPASHGLPVTLPARSPFCHQPSTPFFPTLPRPRPLHFSLRLLSSVGQSDALVKRRSSVRTRQGAPW